MIRYCKITGLVVLISQIVGCTQLKKPDPLEPLNRVTFGLNKVLDTVILKPTARAYDALIPKPLQASVGNFFQNLSEIPNVGNDLLQGKFSQARSDAARFLLNSTWGVGGLCDVAALRGGLERHHQDFGLTLAHWGYKNSIYLVIPLFGPSTVRDGIGRVATYFMGLPPYLENMGVRHGVAWRNGLFIAESIHYRAQLLKAEPIINEAVDEYVFIRDAYFQHRLYEINGGTEAVSTQEILLVGPPE